MFDICPNDDSFGPQSGCRAFDFTLTFEAAILSILPTALFILLSAAYVIWERRLIFKDLQWSSSKREAFVGVVFTLQSVTALFALIVWSIILQEAPIAISATNLMEVSLILTFISSTIQLILILTKPSSTSTAFALSLYHVLTILLDSARVRTFVLTLPLSANTKENLNGGTTTTLFLASFISYFALRIVSLLALNIPPTAPLAPPNPLPPITTHHNPPLAKPAARPYGFFSQLFLLWALPLMWRGRKGNLTIDDLPDVPGDLDSEVVYARFQRAWRHEQQTNHMHHPLLIRVLFRTFWRTFLSAAPPAIVRTLAQAVQPLLINAAIKFISSYTPPSSSSSIATTTSSNSNHTDPDPPSYGWSLAGAFALIFLALAGATSLYFYHVARTVVGLRGALVEAIYRKGVRMRVGGVEGVGMSIGGDPVNLMSTDIERITFHVDPLHQLWSSLITLSLTLSILSTQISHSFLAALLTSLLILLLVPLLSHRITHLETTIGEANDARVRLISGVVRGMRGVKVGGYEEVVERRVFAAREREVKARRAFWGKFAGVVCLTNVTMNVLSLITLGTYSILAYVTHSEPLSTARLFTVYSALGIIAASLFAIGQNFPGVVGAYASVKRIEAYLNSPEVEVELDGEKGDRENGMGQDQEREKKAMQEKGKESREQERFVFENASVGWGQKVVLDGLSVYIPMHHLTIVVGPVASGKSTLLSTLLHETMLTSGSLFVPRCWARDTLSYCSQTPWLQFSKTIAQNIVFASASEVEEEAYGGGDGDGGWYDVVIKACALDVDLRRIRGGDGALAGGLSGGQKARVALARAVYSRKPVVILDDVFAALDNRTSEMVFDALLGEGGLLRGKTVVLATNKLSQLRHADWIITLRQGGAATQGRYNETGDLSDWIFENQVTSAKGVSEQGKQQREVVETVDDDITPIDGIDKLDTGSVNWQTYLHYIRAVGWPRMLIYAVLLFITIVIQTVTPVYLQIWSTYNDERHDEPSTGQALAKFLGGYVAFEIAYSISLSVLFYYVIMAVSLRASTNLHAMQFAALVRAPLSFFDTTQVGQIISRFSQDIFIIDDAFPIALYDLGFQGAKAFGSTILMIVSVPYLTVVVILVVVLAYFVQRFYLATSKQLRRLDMASKSPLYTLFQETIQFDGLLTIRAGSSEDYLTNINSSLLSRSQKPFYLTNVSSAWLASTIGLITALVNTSIVILAVATRRSTNAGLLAVGLTQAVSLQDVISLMMTSWTQMEISIVAVERNLEYCKSEPEEKDGGNGAELPGPEWPTCGDVAVENLFAQYTVGSEPVLRGVSFHALQGTKLAICGRTGSGKSTILMALVHALCVQGSISIDGVNVLRVPRRVLRQNITVVLQDPFVLDGTVRENLDVGGDSTDEDVWSALEAVQLKSAVAAFDDQLDHELRSSHHELSQGQMQLLSLARAMLRGNKILILDEATGNMDAETDDVIQNVIRTRFAEATVIAIAHRTSTIADYDHVLFLEDGVVVESGLPGKLLRDGN